MTTINYRSAAFLVVRDSRDGLRWAVEDRHGQLGHLIVRVAAMTPEQARRSSVYTDHDSGAGTKRLDWRDIAGMAELPSFLNWHRKAQRRSDIHLRGRSLPPLPVVGEGSRQRVRRQR
jgi:hypothetical protein